MPMVSAKDGEPLHYAVHDDAGPWKDAPVLIPQHGFGRSGRFWFNLIHGHA
jgi:3-oxoadipate enol-lactonase